MTEIYFRIRVVKSLAGKAGRRDRGLDYGCEADKIFAGLAMIQLGVATFLAVGIGSDSFTVFTQGFSKVLHISVGAGNCLLTLLLLGIVFWLDRSQFRIGMVLSVAFAGLLLNGMTFLLGKILPQNPSLPVIVLEFAAACVVVSFGFPLLKSAELGVAPNDAFYLALVKRQKSLMGWCGCAWMPYTWCLVFMRRCDRRRHTYLCGGNRSHGAVCNGASDFAERIGRL